MSTGDTEEALETERELVVYNPQLQIIPQEPAPETRLVQRYWRLGDTRPIKFTSISGFKDLRGRYSNWGPTQYPCEGCWGSCPLPTAEQKEKEYKELDNILIIRGSLFFNFPKDQGWDFLYRKVLTFVHGEEAITEELGADIKPLSITKARKINYWYTKTYRHSFIPVLEFTATFDQQRRECAKGHLAEETRDPWNIGDLHPGAWGVSRRVRRRTDSSGGWTSGGEL